VRWAAGATGRGAAGKALHRTRALPEDALKALSQPGDAFRQQALTAIYSLSIDQDQSSVAKAVAGVRATVAMRWSPADGRERGACSGIREVAAMVADCVIDARFGPLLMTVLTTGSGIPGR
jgi:hypothetical protein